MEEILSRTNDLLFNFEIQSIFFKQIPKDSINTKFYLI